MNNKFTENELKVKKWWLMVFFVSFAFTLANSFMHPDFTKSSKNVMFFGIGCTCLYKLMFYYFGYIRRGTKFLAFALFLFAFGFGMQLFFFLFPVNISFIQLFNSNIKKMNPILLIIDYLISFSFFYITLKFRKINKLNKLQKTNHTSIN